MIKVNLAPPEELDSQFWFVPDLLLLVVVFLIGYSAVSVYIGQIENEIRVTNESVSEMSANLKKLEPNLKKFDELTKTKKQLNEKAESLKNITKVRISRYKPVIVMEHLQNMKPDGVWLSSLSINKGGKNVEFAGLAMTNSLISEYLTTLKSTINTLVEWNDLRSQIYFYGPSLGFSRVIQGKTFFPDVKKAHSFEVGIKVGVQSADGVRKQ